MLIQITKVVPIRVKSMEAEYLATKEAVYLRIFLKHVMVVPCVERSIMIFCDNSSAISIIRDPKCHSNAKHIAGKYYYIKEMIRKHEVCVEKVAFKNNLAYPFTKCLPVSVFSCHVQNMGLSMF